jgi:pyrroloquinoline quinone biosynthesis protein E
VSLGERCPVQCTACYTDAGPSGGVADRARLRADLASLASLGVFEIALGGGEPLSHPDLGEVLDAVAAEGMVPNLTTSGVGLTPALAARIAARAGQVNVSLDGDGEDYAAVRGWRGADVAWRAIAMLRAAGVPVGVNTVLTRQTFDALPALGARLAAAGVVEWQWLRLKPTGRGADRYAALALTAAQRRALWGRLLEVEAATGLRMRVDCAMVPFLAAGSPPPEALARLGVLGCPGGTDLMAVDGAGVVRPCSFVQGPAPAGEGSVAARWEADPTLRAWRDRGAAPPEPCASCPYQASCRGGCRVVAGHVTGDGLAPDPECERVAAWSEAGWNAGT